jgi:hypothetical protein
MLLFPFSDHRFFLLWRPMRVVEIGFPPPWGYVWESFRSELAFCLFFFIAGIAGYLSLGGRSTSQSKNA